MERGINMTVVELVELIKVEAQPDILDDVDKWMFRVNVDGKQYRVALEYSEIETPSDVVTLLSGVLTKISDGGSPTNYTEQWKGVYNV